MGVFNTPLSNWDGVWGKEEFRNGSGSVKDRPALFMLQRAVKEGITEVVEATSGNTGIALAFYGRRLGVKVTIFMPASYSEERQRLLRGLGANLILTEGGMGEAVEEARKYSRELNRDGKRAVYLDQFSNPANWEAHYFTTGPEILTQFPTIKRVVVAVGSGGSIVGIGKALKRRGVEVVAVEPKESPALYNRLYNTTLPVSSHRVEGIGAGFVPPLLQPHLHLIDRVVLVDSEEVVEFWKRAVKKGFTGGISAAASILAVKQQGWEGDNTLTLFPDHLNRYYSRL
jgi:cysteine synthase A